MPSPTAVHRQVEKLTADFVGLGLCNSQNFPSLRVDGDFAEISYSGVTDLSFVLKNQPYRDMYQELVETRAYNMLMVDGAIIQLMYQFQNGELTKHRLAFFPSPDLDEYQNNAEIYELDEIYADIVYRNIIAFPIRFDFDGRQEVYQEIHHPKSHLTLGQYKNCRIPVHVPVTPYLFLSFILRNFYNTAFKKHSENITAFKDSFEECIFPAERSIFHLSYVN
ncbi:DUF2290 domain-containing protein [Stutzerimonas stutzeri]|uniref:DUF2290 domain-containing protein n=2 Tax=Stutzerimonas stutzeri TaxID=316 RepID=UPI000F7A4E2C|nr:DUF2290 domain-containing protein [Stutzerimonas stutzeri]RRV58451.1 DUF2290 domain-containing protein [Stutzerimonas stutzeri]